MGLTRRKFLAGIALGGASALAAGMTGCEAKTQDAEPSSGSKDASADRIKHTPESTETCDIVVVGSGTAGMSAAVRAAQLGAKVIMLEKNAFFGGSSGYAEGVGGVNSYMHEEAGLHFDTNEVFQRTQEYHHWSADSNVLRRYIEHSGETIDWLHNDCGVNFYAATITAPTSYPTWHLGADADGNVARIKESLIDVMAEYGKGIGVDMRTKSPATGLLVEDDAIKGVYYEQDGKEYAIEAEAVILATGGYSNNQEMFEEFTHIPFDRVWNWGAAGRDGDGIRWARALGADLHIPSNLMFGSTRCAEANMFEDHAGWVFSWEPALRVNQDGVRFFDETMATDFSRGSNAIAAQQSAFTIIDQAYLDQINDVALPMGLESVGLLTGQPMPDARDSVTKAVEDGKVFKADTIEELADQLGLDAKTLAATVDEYNTCAGNGIDPVYGTQGAALVPVATPPFYASKAQLAVFTSVGGLRVDEDLRVLDTDGKPIDRLYAIGTDASSYAGRDYDVGIFSGAQQGWCAYGGKHAAEHILGR